MIKRSEEDPNIFSGSITLDGHLYWVSGWYDEFVLSTLQRHEPADGRRPSRRCIVSPYTGEYARVADAVKTTLDKTNAD